VTGGARFQRCPGEWRRDVEPVPGIRAYASYAEGYTVPDIGRITRAVNKSPTSISTPTCRHRADRLEQPRDRRRVKRGPFDASVTYFWSSSDKGQLLIANPGGIFDVQRQRVEIQGIEVNLGVKLPIDGLRVSAAMRISTAATTATCPTARSTPISTAPTSRPIASTSRPTMPAARSRALMQTQFFLSRSFKGRIRDPRNDFGGYTLTDAYLRYQTGHRRADVQRVEPLRQAIYRLQLGHAPADRQSQLFRRARPRVHARLGLLSGSDENARPDPSLDRRHLGLVLAIMGLTGAILVHKESWLR
jgi:hypothetical protein